MRVSGHGYRPSQHVPLLEAVAEQAQSEPPELVAVIHVAGAEKQPVPDLGEEGQVAASGGVFSCWLSMLPIPLRIIKEGAGELLKVAPDLKVQEGVNTEVGNALLAAGMPDHKVRMVRVGREFWVLVHVLLDQGHILGSTGELDAIRETVHQAVAKIEKGMVVDIVFTSREDLI